MTQENFGKVANVALTAGHLLVVWDILANKLSGSEFLDKLDESERRAIWALQDFCESKLETIGFSSRPQLEWEALMDAARAHVKTVPVEFLDK